MKTFIAKDEAAFLFQLGTFSEKITLYAEVLGITPTEVASVQADHDFLSYILGYNNRVQSYAHNFTQYKNLLRFGNGSEVLGAVPALSALPTPQPALVVANIEARFRALVQRCATSGNFNNAIGEDLGIIAPDTPFNPAEGKPVFTVEPGTGGSPLLKWKKGKFHGVEIWKDAGEGAGWKKLDRDMRPDFIDKSPLPPAGVAKVWRYKMIYLFNDDQVGGWSEEATITVYGEV